MNRTTPDIELGAHVATICDAACSECPICLQEASSLQTTACGHSFCESCLRQHIEMHPVDGGVSCPVCRQPMRPADMPKGVVPRAPPGRSTAAPDQRRRCGIAALICLGSVAFMGFLVVGAHMSDGGAGVIS